LSQIHRSLQSSRYCPKLLHMILRQNGVMLSFCTCPF
jgi:hypothetical protein